MPKACGWLVSATVIQQTKQVNTMKRKGIFKTNNVLILNGATRINGNTDLILKAIIESSENKEVKINHAEKAVEYAI